MTARLHNYIELGAYIEKRASGLASGHDTTAHQRASRLLASESAGGLNRERCAAELRERP